MRLLILGGTAFLGRHLVDAARARDHEVTLFNRGQHDADAFPDLESLRGDRDGGLDVLRGRTWDAVIDTCGYTPRVVRASAELLADAVDHYAFISSISVYQVFSPHGTDENAALRTLADPEDEDVHPATYGGLKVLCERAVDAGLPDRAVHVRAGFIVGAHDQNARFPYWLRRFRRGGEVLAPGQPDRVIQLIGARDLARWVVLACERHTTGAVNVTGTPGDLTMGQFLDAVRAQCGGDARVTWADDEFLRDHGVAPVDGLPYWIPRDMAGLSRVRVDRALASGLTLRPIADTVRDTLAWLDAGGRGADSLAERYGIVIGVSQQREDELLAAWHRHIDEV